MRDGTPVVRLVAVTDPPPSEVGPPRSVMIVAQSMTESLPVVTAGRAIAALPGVTTLR